MFNIEQESYKHFRSIVRERTNKILVWVGSGLSQPVGFPSWSALRDSLCAELENKAKNIVEDVHEKERLLKAASEARRHSNLWVAFEIVKRTLGETSFQAAVRAQFKGAETCPIPSIYLRLWDLPIAGILNLNLDRLATRAFHQTGRNCLLHEFQGKVAGRYAHILKGTAPFIVNLHGILADSASWVFTYSELKELLNNPGYREFLHACLIDSTILFIGVTADDIAVGGHLERLRKWNINFGEHYWLTDRGDIQTLEWAERSGVRVIKYSSDGDHHEVSEFFSDLLSYVPKETEPIPVAMEPAAQEMPELPTPQDLLKEDPNTARVLLNKYASFILKERTAEAYKRYEDFCKEYDRAIYNAWYVTDKSPDNRLFDYMLVEEIAEGAFGRVFRAEDCSGKSVAIKLLKEDVRRKPELLKSFRRGVASMRILAEHGVEGMVEYKEASEIPTFVVMEFIQGPDLRKAVEVGYISDWSTVMRVAVDLAHIIRRAHLLPERVLHRDLRPSNIMLKDYYLDPDDYTVVVLDFDLSWHRGAIEDSIITDSTLNGYLAPEQVEHMPSAYTRNALVDSFGMGMTLFFLRTGLHPQLLQHRYSNWGEYVHANIEKYDCPTWASLPRRYARLIEFCTRDKQAERWDMSRIEDELERLQKALVHPEAVQSAELWADELAARVEGRLGTGKTYIWDQDRGVAVFSFASGVELRVSGDEVGQQVRAWVTWTSRGDQEHRRIGKYLPTKCERALAGLRRGGWRLSDSKRSMDMVRYEAVMSVGMIRTRIDQATAALVNAAEEFDFG